MDMDHGHEHGPLMQSAVRCLQSLSSRIRNTNVAVNVNFQRWKSLENWKNELRAKGCLGNRLLKYNFGLPFR